MCLVRILSGISFFLALVAFTSMENFSMFLTIIVIDLRPQNNVQKLDSAFH